MDYYVSLTKHSLLSYDPQFPYEGSGMRKWKRRASNAASSMGMVRSHKGIANEACLASLVPVEVFGTLLEAWPILQQRGAGESTGFGGFMTIALNQKRREEAVIGALL